MEDDVSAVGDSSVGIGLSGSRICERVYIELLNSDIRICIDSTCAVSVSKLVHGFVCHTDYKTDVVGLGHQACNITYQVGALLVFEHQAGNIVKINRGIINNGKSGVRIFFCHRFGRVCQHIAYTDDQVILFIYEGFQVRNIVRIGSGFQVVDLYAKIFSCSLKTFP